MTAFRDPETGNAFRRINGREVHFQTTARTSHLNHPWWLEAMRNPLGDTRNLVYVVPQNDVNRFVLIFFHNDNTNTYTFWMRADETFGVTYY